MGVCRFMKETLFEAQYLLRVFLDHDPDVLGVESTFQEQTDVYA